MLYESLNSSQETFETLLFVCSRPRVLSIPSSSSDVELSNMYLIDKPGNQRRCQNGRRDSISDPTFEYIKLSTVSAFLDRGNQRQFCLPVIKIRILRLQFHRCWQNLLLRVPTIEIRSPCCTNTNPSCLSGVDLQPLISNTNLRGLAFTLVGKRCMVRGFYPEQCR